MSNTTLIKLNAKQAQALYLVAVGMCPTSKPQSAASQAHEANLKNENMSKCLVMNNQLKAASTDKQEKAIALVQEALVAGKGAITADKAKALIPAIAEAAGLKNRTTGKFNKSLAKNYLIMATQRVAAGLAQ